MKNELKRYLSEVLKDSLQRVSPLSGGDIAKAYLLETPMEKFFCKILQGPEAQKMLLAERTGLEALRRTKAIAVPKILHLGHYKGAAFLILEYVDSKTPDKEDLEVFGRQLAMMHQSNHKGFFGFPSDNYIGRLYQSNKPHLLWCTFYVEERLYPQLRLAGNKGLLETKEIPSEGLLLQTCSNLFPTVFPSLLHGDLWGGNFIISHQGRPYLIDPSVYYGHYEVDLAMTRLFGGFGDSFYGAFEEIIPSENGAKERMGLYQLYYLLVHLNLFGAPYKKAVTRILSTYF